MSLWQFIERSIGQRKLSSALTALSVALGMMLVSAILLLQRSVDEHFLRPGRGYSLVVGAPGSQLQLVLNAVYHLDRSPGLLPVRVLDELRENSSVALAVPYAVGDSFRGYRVVGTTADLFDARFPSGSLAGSLAGSRKPAERLAAGRPFRYSDEALQRALAGLGRGQNGSDGSKPGHDDVYEAVLGAEVATRLGISVGDRIEPTHGVDGGDAHEQAALWTVVGILGRTDTPLDRVVFINLDSFYRIPDHQGGLMPGTGEPALSAILVFPRAGMHKALLLSRLDKRPDLQVADVQREVRNLLGLVGNIDIMFLLIAILVVIVGVVSIMVAIYNTMNERRRELAILRAIGARRHLIVALIVGEASVLAFCGAALGVLLSRLLVVLVSDRIAAAAGFRPDPLRLLPEELVILAVVTLVGALAGLVPAWTAYRTDVARNLAPLS